MREYLFYVLLVFLPIGAFMVKILLDHGLPVKNTAYIVLTSLAIIVTFPISMEKLGILLAFTVYAILILLIILYMVKTTNNMSLDTVAGGAIPENNNIDLNNQPHHAETLGMEIKAPVILEQMLESVVSESVQMDEAADEVANNVVDMAVEASEVDEIEIAENEDVIEAIISEREELLNTDEISLQLEDDNNDGRDLEIQEDNPAEMKTEQNEEIAEQHDIEDSEPMGEEIKDEAIKETIREAVEEVITHVAGHDTTTHEAKEGIFAELPLAIQEDELIPAPEEKMVEKEDLTPEPEDRAIVANDEEVNSQALLSEEIISYINEAFMFKTEGNNEKAIEKFLLIWENTKDYDLKHLVTLELVQMYKTAGLYMLAQELLARFYEEIKDTNSFIASQVIRELTYMNLLTGEIKRLRLEQVPFDKLPRWVKIKIADELNQLV